MIPIKHKYLYYVLNYSLVKIFPIFILRACDTLPNKQSNCEYFYKHIFIFINCFEK